jgi:hypothetical protein
VSLAISSSTRLWFIIFVTIQICYVSVGGLSPEKMRFPLIWRSHKYCSHSLSLWERDFLFFYDTLLSLKLINDLKTSKALKTLLPFMLLPGCFIFCWTFSLCTSTVQVPVGTRYLYRLQGRPLYYIYCGMVLYTLFSRRTSTTTILPVVHILVLLFVDQYLYSY